MEQLFIFPFTLFKDQEQLIDLNPEDYRSIHQEVSKALKSLDFDEESYRYNPNEVPVRTLISWHQDFIQGIKSLYNNPRYQKTVSPFYSLWQSIYSEADSEAYSFLDSILNYCGIDLLSEKMKAYNNLENALQAMHEAEQHGIVKSF